MYCIAVEMARVELASKQVSQIFSTRLVYFDFSLINQVENNRTYYLSFKSSPAFKGVAQTILK